MNVKKEIWLLISGFGIMFAVLSWLQESYILPTTLLGLNWLKGVIALITGFILYLSFRKSL